RQTVPCLYATARVHKLRNAIESPGHVCLRFSRLSGPRHRSAMLELDFGLASLIIYSMSRYDCRGSARLQPVADGQYNNGQYVQSTQYGTIYSSGQGSQPSGTQYGSSTMNPNTQNLQYDQSSNTYNNQQSYPSNQNSASGVQYDPNMAYSNQQNQAGYNPQTQQAQYSNNGQGQAYPYNQQNQPGYNTQMDQSQNFNNGQPQMYSNDQQQIYGYRSHAKKKASEQF
ncbi:hypothetical protein OSTOST_06147, partial [Ostertagia ostertagi]